MRCYQETGEPEYPCNGSNGTQRSMGTVRLAEEPSPSVQTAARRLKIDEENIKNGLAQLVMTLIKLLHELLERQAIQRMESDSLDEGQIERLGLTLMKQSEEIQRLCRVFGLEEEDLNLDLGPLGKLL